MEPKTFYQKYNFAMWLFYGIAIVAIDCLFRGCLSPDVKPSIEVPTKEIKEQVKGDTKPVQQSIDKSAEVQKKLATENATLKQQLYAAQQRVKELAGKVVKFDHFKNNEITGIDSTLPDEYTTELIAAADTSANIANRVIANLEKQIQEKDTTISLQQLKYAILEKGFGQVLSNDFQKDKTIKELNRKLKWQKVKGTVLTGTGLVMAAVIVKSLIK